jgi:hypothetical protein
MKSIRKDAELLVSFANARREDFARIVQSVHKATGKVWQGGIEDFVQTQERIREVWEGKRDGGEAVALGLGLVRDHSDCDSKVVPEVDWKHSTMRILGKDLNAYMWLLLLENSKRLCVCENVGTDCQHPYFIQKKPNQRFCSSECAVPSQREFKRKWWGEHGEQWRNERSQKVKRSKKKGREER